MCKTSKVQKITISMKGHWKFKGRKRDKEGLRGGGGGEFKFGISREVSEYIQSKKSSMEQHSVTLSKATLL